MKTRTGALMVLTLVVAVIMTACSSGGGGGAPATSAPVIAQGVMQKGSVIVNGVTFDDTAAKIAADDSANLPTTFLQDGMVVKVKGKRNDDGLNGTADQVEVENEVRGAITANDGVDRITVNGQTVLIDGATVFANVTPGNNFAGLAAGNNVEVHGQRDATGVIHASRVEELGVGAVVDEVRGPISGLSGTGFSISGLTVTTNASTVIVPAGTALANGMVVEVHFSGSTATRVEIEDLEDDEFRHGEGVEFEVEGLISGFTGSDTFKVGSESVTINSSTRFEGGIKGDLVNDVKVEAEGHSRSGGALLAEKITFKENIRIEAVAGGTGSANVLGLTVKTTSLTRFEGLANEAAIATGNGLRIRGFLNRDGSITATRVILQNPDSNGRSILQGPAVEVNTGAKTMRIAGIDITMATGAQSFNDDSTDSVDDNVPFASLDQFFAAIGSKTMIVKAKGTFASGTLTATEIEIE